MLELEKKVHRAVEVLRAFEPENEPYYLCYSGGKDSDCIRILAELAGVSCDIVHNLTSVDAPETVRYIKTIPDIIINRAHYKDGTPKTMWNLIPRRLMPPTRKVRYCCSELKEHGGRGRLKITGVRSAESVARRKNAAEIKIIGKPATTRKYLEAENISYNIAPAGGISLNFDNTDSRRAVEHCFRNSSTLINPIIDWSDSEVWQFLDYYGCKSNPLYGCKHKRIGCIGCPFASSNQRKLEFTAYPAYYANYVRAFERMLSALRDKGCKTSWTSGEDVMHWWLRNDILSGQLAFDGFSVSPIDI